MHNITTINRRNLWRMQENIAEVWRGATIREVLQGEAWYKNANATLADMGAAHGATPRVACGVAAALSPMLAWHKNLEYAERFLATGTAPCLGRNVAKAQRIVEGEDPNLVLSGDKVRSFFLCLFLPDVSRAVVVDRHAFDVAVGRVTDDKQRKQLERVGVYDLIAEAYRNVAESASATTLPHVVQATTWEAWRNDWAPYAAANRRRAEAASLV